MKFLFSLFFKIKIKIKKRIKKRAKKSRLCTKILGPFLDYLTGLDHKSRIQMTSRL